MKTEMCCKKTSRPCTDCIPNSSECSNRMELKHIRVAVEYDMYIPMHVEEAEVDNYLEKRLGTDNFMWCNGDDSCLDMGE